MLCRNRLWRLGLKALGLFCDLLMHHRNPGLAPRKIIFFTGAGAGFWQNSEYRGRARDGLSTFFNTEAGAGPGLTRFTYTRTGAGFVKNHWVFTGVGSGPRSVRT